MLVYAYFADTTGHLEAIPSNLPSTIDYRELKRFRLNLRSYLANSVKAVIEQGPSSHHRFSLEVLSE